MRLLTTLLPVLTISLAIIQAAPITPDSVAVLYNRNIAQSKELAEYYAKARNIPRANLIGLDMSDKGGITREDYNDTIRDPLRRIFAAREWWAMTRNPQGNQQPATSKITTLVCMRGVPFKINRLLPKPSAPKPQGAFAKANEAAVDSELALLGVHNLPIGGPLKNPYHQKDVSFSDAKLPFMLMVGRIDAPTFQTCKRMIDDAIAIEARGLWGMCYLDLAQKGSGYAVGDQWIENIAKLNNRTGIPTVVERHKQTFTTNYPMEDASIYFGWYTTHRNGPLLNPDFQFRKGAVAVHLHSYSASYLRMDNKHWCGPLLAKGAAATLGNTFEPYLHLTHHFDIFYDRLIKGYSLVEAAYMATPATSWQSVVLGDPLYRPFLRLDGSGTKKLEDRDYRAIRVAQQRWGDEPETMIKKLRTAAAAKSNGRLYEYLGLWHWHHKKHQVAIAFFQTASKKHLRESDRLRQWLYTADIHRQTGNKTLAVRTLKKAKETIADIPEAKTTAALLNILDPPQPPPVKKPATKPKKPKQ